MPCGNHPNLSGSSCVDCVISDLLALDPGDKKAKTTLAELQRRFEKLDLSEDQRDLCTTLIAHVNGHLLQGGLRFGELIHPNQIRREDRLAYRARLRTMGTWIGFYEFTVLAEIYGVGFYIAMPASARNRWRRYPIGDGPYQQHMVLRWNGTHYDLAKLMPVVNSHEFTAVTARDTNPLGDCGLEAFLLLIFLSGAGRPTGGLRRMDALDVRHLFKAAAKWAGQQVIPATNYDYQCAIRKLRELLAAQMSDQQIDLSIIAQGVLPTMRELPTWHQLMRVEEARNLVLEQELTAVSVGVVDSGFDVGHIKLRNAIKQDVGGRDADHVGGRDADHGTLCCGLIVGEPEPGQGYLGGVARNDDDDKLQVSLMVTSYDLDSGATKDIARCESLVERGVRVFNLSYRALGEKLSVMGEAINSLNYDLRQRGLHECTFVVAAGNEGKLYPHQLNALGQHAIVVAATSVQLHNGHHVERAIRDCNRGPGVTVCAPGSGTEGKNDGLLRVISTKPKGRYGPHTNTSAATPMVVGVIALMVSVDPTLTPATIREILCLTAVKIDEDGGEWKSASCTLNKALIPNGLGKHHYSVRYGFGRVDAEAAVREVIRRMK